VSVQVGKHPFHHRRGGRRPGFRGECIDFSRPDFLCADFLNQETGRRGESIETIAGKPLGRLGSGTVLEGGASPTHAGDLLI